MHAFSRSFSLSLSPIRGRASEGMAMQARCALTTQLGFLALAKDGPTYGGVSSFGYSGTIAHGVLRSPAKNPAKSPLALARKYN